MPIIDAEGTRYHWLVDRPGRIEPHGVPAALADEDFCPASISRRLKEADRLRQQLKDAHAEIGRRVMARGK